jgi:hypothetical protein
MVPLAAHEDDLLPVVHRQEIIIAVLNNLEGFHVGSLKMSSK